MNGIFYHSTLKKLARKNLWVTELLKKMQQKIKQVKSLNEK